MAELRWSEPHAEKGYAASSFLHKLEGWLPVLGVSAAHSAAEVKQAVVLPPAGHGGKGRKRRCWSSSTTVRWGVVFSLRPHATHAEARVFSLILRRYGGPSSTSIVEACQTLCRSSSVRCRQVIRSRRLRPGRRQRFIAGRERSSVTLQYLGAESTWRLPATRGGDAQVPDCFLTFGAGVFFAILEALSSNSRFFRTSIVKGLFVILYPPHVMII